MMKRPQRGLEIDGFILGGAVASRQLCNDLEPASHVSHPDGDEDSDHP